MWLSVYHGTAPRVRCATWVLLYAAAARAQDSDRERRAEPEEIAAATPAPVQPTKVTARASSVTEITVSGSRKGPMGAGEVLTSANLLSREKVQSQTAADPLHVLKRVPGVYMEDYHQRALPTGLSTRGFTTQGDVAAVKLLIDGIPSNFHAGTSELKALFPLEIERIEVVKGTNDARYGLNNVAGNVNVFSRQNEEVQIARVLMGSFRTLEPQLLSGFRTGPLRHTYFVGYRGSDGFRDNSQMERVAASAKVFYEPNERLRLGLIARGMSLEAQSPGYLTPKEAREQPRLSPAYARQDAGVQQTLHLSGHVDYLTA